MCIKIMADSYLVLWEKHKIDVLEICGKEVMADRYYKASQKYLFVKSNRKAWESFKLAKKNGSIGVTAQIRWYILYLKNFF